MGTRWEREIVAFCSRLRPDIAAGGGGSVGPSLDYERVPRISTFYGIVIAMYYRDHAPPHFHAIYGEHEATIVIGDLNVLSGFLPTRAL